MLRGASRRISRGFATPSPRATARTARAGSANAFPVNVASNRHDRVREGGRLVVVRPIGDRGQLHFP
eukprot:337361-Lingulodinium_polyedra.AAC.1